MWLMLLKTTLIIKIVKFSGGCCPRWGNLGSPQRLTRRTVPAAVSWPRRRRVSNRALYRSPLASQNWGEQPEYSQAPTAPAEEGCARLLPRPSPA